MDCRVDPILIRVDRDLGEGIIRTTGWADIRGMDSVGHKLIRMDIRDRTGMDLTKRSSIMFE